MFSEKHRAFRQLGCLELEELMEQRRHRFGEQAERDMVCI